MKKALLIFSFFNATLAFAQKDAGLKKNQEITITTSTKQTIDMGMQMTNNTNLTSKIVVLDVNAKNYTVTSTNIKMVMDGNMMGQAVNYDSDKKEDRESQIGQQFDQLLNKTDTVLLDVKTGKGNPIDARAITEKVNDMQSMMVGSVENSSAVSASSILFIIPGDKKAGTQWTDSTSADGMKTVNAYKIESISGNIATISSNGSVQGSSTMDMQGQTFDMNIKTKMTGTLLMDITTNLVKKRNNVADVEGSVEMMGQSMPFTSKTEIEITYK